MCNILKNGRKLKAAWLVGESDHAGHLTGRGGRLWRERWLNGSDVGRLRGKRKVGNIRTKGLVVQTHRQKPFLLCWAELHATLASAPPPGLNGLPGSPENDSSSQVHLEPKVN